MKGSTRASVWDTADQDQDKELSAVFVAHIIDTLIKENDSEPEEFVYEDDAAEPWVQGVIIWRFVIMTVFPL